jgi:hypothetical protein
MGVCRNQEVLGASELAINEILVNLESGETDTESCACGLFLVTDKESSGQNSEPTFLFHILLVLQIVCY